MLDKIIAYKKLELEHIRRKAPLRDLRLKVRDTEPACPFFKNFDDTINIIAEIKKASPSAGVIREDFNPVDIATVYAENGARALSVLTDENFFQGKLEYLSQIRKHLAAIHKNPIPLLRKDFTLHEYHLYEARAAGADAILLIVAVLDPFELRDHQALAAELGLTVLVEVHDKAELDVAMDLGAEAIGINNRNLKTFETDVQTTRDLVAYWDETVKYVLPVGTTAEKLQKLKETRLISESGLKDRETLVDLKKIGVNGFLIGETFMREKDFGKKLKEFLDPR